MPSPYSDGMWLMMRPGDEPVADAGETGGEGDGEGGGGAIEIGDDVINVFQADGQAHQLWRNSARAWEKIAS